MTNFFLNLLAIKRQYLRHTVLGDNYGCTNRIPNSQQTLICKILGSHSCAAAHSSLLGC